MGESEFIEYVWIPAAAVRDDKVGSQDAFDDLVENRDRAHTIVGSFSDDLMLSLNMLLQVEIEVVQLVREWHDNETSLLCRRVACPHSHWRMRSVSEEA